MKTYYYKRTLLYDLQIQIPDFFIKLDDLYDKNCQSLKEAYLIYGLKYPENILRRYSDAKFYSLLVRDEFNENKNPFQASLRLSTYLVGYFNSLKSFLDAIAITLNDIFLLNLKPIDKDLCRKKIWSLLPKEINEKYKQFSVDFETIRNYRNAASHRFYPIVMVCGPSSIRVNKTPSQIERSNVDILLVDNPENDANVLFDRHSIRWKNPITLIENLDNKLYDLADLIINDFTNFYFYKMYNGNNK